MRVRVREVSFRLSDCRTRLPFRFGIHTMTAAPTLTARVELEGEAGAATGYSAELLVPKWFEKDPAKSLAEDERALVASARAAAEAFAAAGEGSAFELWHAAYRARVAAAPVDAPDRLVRGFGVALVERAVLDAACRAADASFFDALKRDLFGVRPGALYPELADWDLAASLPDAPARRVAVRHTVGLVDALRPEDVAARIDDGLPECLVEDVRAYGLRYFKLKLCGELEADLARTLTFGEVLRDEAPPGWRFTVDGNEQFRDARDLVAFFDALADAPGGLALLDALLYVEQPLPRALSLGDGARTGLAALREVAPVILDEADHGLEALPRALDLGYGGVSVKNCKGVLRALCARGLCERRGAFQSGEDLTNLGVLALQQDLATMAALGLPHVERNGHHYFRGLDHLPPREAAAAAAAHPDLWRTTDRGVALRLDHGELALDSLQGVGYGYACEIDWAARAPLEDDAPTPA
ncbi:MAG: mandelate racemase [Planctomycetes bacterium]|nr:mandelate racemase [Planctomycetota bacterium]